MSQVGAQWGCEGERTHIEMLYPVHGRGRICVLFDHFVGKVLWVDVIQDQRYGSPIVEFREGFDFVGPRRQAE